MEVVVSANEALTGELGMGRTETAVFTGDGQTETVPSSSPCPLECPEDGNSLHSWPLLSYPTMLPLSTGDLASV